jgi:hypothetical protein
MKICLPNHVQEMYQRYTSASNIPRLGVEDNCYFQALQLNISPAIPWEKRFGKCLSYFTTTISNSML